MSGDSDILDTRPVAAQESDWLEEGLRGVGFFSALARGPLAQGLPYMLMLRYARGAVICAEGEPGEAMYLIYHGSVVVEKKGWRDPVAHLKDGDFFGEMALLFGEPRSATVTTLEETEVFCLASEDFHRIVGLSPDMTQLLRKLAETRRRELAQS